MKGDPSLRVLSFFSATPRWCPSDSTDAHTLKPLDRDAVARAARETHHLVTVEEHFIAGGLRGAVAEILAELGTGRFARVGVRDVFCTEVAPYPDLLRIHGVDAPGIGSAVRALLGRD